MSTSQSAGRMAISLQRGIAAFEHEIMRGCLKGRSGRTTWWSKEGIYLTMNRHQGPLAAFSAFTLSRQPHTAGLLKGLKADGRGCVLVCVGERLEVPHQFFINRLFEAHVPLG